MTPPARRCPPGTRRPSCGLEAGQLRPPALDALEWLQQLDASGVGLKILTHDIDTTSAAGRLVFTVLASVAETERELIRERVRAGMARARAKGRQLGRPRRQRPLSKHPKSARVVAALRAGHLNKAEAAKKLRVRRTSLSAALRPVRSGGAFEPPSAKIDPPG